MDKILIQLNTHFYPMPMTLIGTQDEERANFAPIAWVNRANFKPPIIVAAINKNHHTAHLIEKNKEFSINIPSQDLVIKTDYCGLATGSQVDKAKLFEIFHGELKNAPMIKECPINMECKLMQIVKLPLNNLFIAEIVSAYSEDRFLTDGRPDIQKIKPFTLTMPDNRYWSIGDNLGKAWSIGRDLRDKE
jgi:flavin reductase (DIM6/NTAB) family NADH-FMN oxidoreductase RutF